MIVIDEGCEYSGERYIRCSACLPYQVFRSLPGLFEGTTMEELEAFIAAHRDHA